MHFFEIFVNKLSYVTNLLFQVDQRVLYDIISEKYPKIISHFTQLNIDLSLITFNWFLTLFVDNTNIPVILSFWDSFLFEGDKVLYRYALAMFRIHQDQLMACVDAIGVYNFCRIIGESEMCNPKNIREVKFQLFTIFSKVIFFSFVGHIRALFQLKIFK